MAVSAQSGFMAQLARGVSPASTCERVRAGGSRRVDGERCIGQSCGFGFGFFFGGGIIVHSAWGCVLWVAQWRAARALDSQLEGLVGPV